MSFFSTFGQSDEDTIQRVDSSIVVVNATVLDKHGKPLGGLKKEQFTVLEDGVAQEMSMFTPEETPFAAVILIDTSGSMEERISLARSAAVNFLAGLRSTDSAAIFHFDAKVNLIQDFSSSKDISESIFDVKAAGMTALNDAIYKAAAELSKRSEKRRAIIVLSDGADTISKRSASKALKAAMDIDASIYSIDMSSASANSKERIQNQGVLKNFAEKTGGRFIETPGGVAMRKAFVDIVEELGVQYTIAYEPRNLKRDGSWRRIEVVVSKPNLTVRARKGYNAPK